MDWIDISVSLRSGMIHWPGNPPLRIERVREMERGASSNLSALSMGTHSGTHMDAPLHFFRRGKGLDRMPISTAVGPARVIAVEGAEPIQPGDLRPHRIRRGERILLKTRNSARCWSQNRFVTDFVHLSTGAAEFLAERRVRVVGIDYLSVGGYKANGREVHRALLGAGVWIIEGLDLSKVRPGRYELVCLPLRILRSDGAPARAAVRPLRQSR